MANLENKLDYNEVPVERSRGKNKNLEMMVRDYKEYILPKETSQR